ncbi:hypothetical protein [Thiohalorhabdus methylotrophus]|uniref:Uncharacterized protein n=1 Tax=Thiohalorhabdus methylotrophus TaxID=3242694 RepID=A0ABV4TS11_9GAMM
MASKTFSSKQEAMDAAREAGRALGHKAPHGDLETIDSGMTGDYWEGELAKGKVDRFLALLSEEEAHQAWQAGFEEIRQSRLETM